MSDSLQTEKNHNCSCGTESEVGYHGFQNQEIKSYYFCMDCWNRKKREKLKEVEELTEKRGYNKRRTSPFFSDKHALNPTSTQGIKIVL